jgi:hypothetical protein
LGLKHELFFFYFFITKGAIIMVQQMLAKSRLFLKQNSSTILTVIGAVGTIAAVVIAAKDTPKAIKRIETKKEEKGEELTTVEKVVAAAPAYIPSAVICASTLVCIFGANALNKKQQASLISAYALLQNSYKKYKNKVIELYGETVEKTVKEEVAKDNFKEHPIEVSEGKQLFYECNSEQYFESTREDVTIAMYTLNRQLQIEGYVTLNQLIEYFDSDDLKPVDGGDSVGWSIDMLIDDWEYCWIDFMYSPVDSIDGHNLSCVIVSTVISPDASFMDGY